MNSSYDRWFDDVSTTRPDNYAPPRIIVGGDENPTKLTRQSLRAGPWLGDGPPGHWLIDVARPGRYDVMLLIEPTADAPETAGVGFGEHGVTREVSPGAEVCLIRNVAVEKGPMKFGAALTAGGWQRPPLQVILTRRSEHAPDCRRSQTSYLSYLTFRRKCPTPLFLSGTVILSQASDSLALFADGTFSYSNARLGSSSRGCCLHGGM